MRFITFIWIPKCAGYTIETVFHLEHQIVNGSFEYNFGNDKSVTFGHADISILLREEVISESFYRESFKFCIVRNPYDRAVSLFHYLELHKSWSFDDWVKYLFDNRDTIPKNDRRNLVHNGLINNQWNLMSSWIPDDIDKIYRFEDGLAHIIQDVNKQIGWNTKLSNPPRHNRSQHRSYEEYYTNESTRDRIYELYEADSVRFSYSKEL